MATLSHSDEAWWSWAEDGRGKHPQCAAIQVSLVSACTMANRWMASLLCPGWFAHACLQRKAKRTEWKLLRLVIERSIRVLLRQATRDGRLMDWLDTATIKRRHPSTAPTASFCSFQSPAKEAPLVRISHQAIGRLWGHAHEAGTRRPRLCE